MLAIALEPNHNMMHRGLLTLMEINILHIESAFSIMSSSRLVRSSNQSYLFAINAFGLMNMQGINFDGHCEHNVTLSIANTYCLHNCDGIG